MAASRSAGQLRGARLHAEHRPRDQHREVAVRQVQRQRHAAEVGGELGVALEPAALQRALDLLLDRGHAHQRGRRVALEGRAAQHAGAVGRGQQRQQRAARGGDVQRHQLARAGDVADGVRRLDRVDEHRVRAAGGGQHRGLAGAFDQAAQQRMQRVGIGSARSICCSSASHLRRWVVAAARTRLVQVAAAGQRAEQVEGARARPVEVPRHLGQAWRGGGAGRRTRSARARWRLA
jgi:hypothetical protein